MRTKKGFTLIELLAVIVILAVIALIATPLVMSTINDAKEGALKSTVRSIKEEAEKLYVKKVQLNPSENPTVSESEIEYSGDQIPTEDMKVTFNNSGLANIAIYKDSKCVYKLFNDSDATVNKTWTKEECLNSVLLGADMLVAKANTVDKTYSTGIKTEMYTFNQPETEQLEATTDYRYIGNVPNNYVTFNNETWRIIGVFGESIKIIKDESIGTMPRDYKKASTTNLLGSSNHETGSNDWSDSQLMYMLNPTTYSLKQGYTLSGNYIKDTNGNIIYEIGKKPALVEVGATTYGGAENTWKLSDEALALVVTTTYYLGGLSWKDDTNPWGNAAAMYAEERGTSVFGGRPTNWTGKVGLMYPSDYVYTFAKGVEDNCYDNSYICTASNSEIPSSSWLYTIGQHQWTISPSASRSNLAFLLDMTGYVEGRCGIFYTMGIRPTVYLRSDVLLKGTGTEADPYKIIG